MTTPTETQKKEWTTPEVKLLDQADDAKAGGLTIGDGGGACS